MCLPYCLRCGLPLFLEPALSTAYYFWAFSALALPSPGLAVAGWQERHFATHRAV